MLSFTENELSSCFFSYLEVPAGSTTNTSALPFARLFGLGTAVEALGLRQVGVVVVHLAQRTVTGAAGLLIGVVATQGAWGGRRAVLRAVVAWQDGTNRLQ